MTRRRAKVAQLPKPTPDPLVCPHCGNRHWDMEGEYYWQPGEHGPRSECVVQRACSVCRKCGVIEPVRESARDRELLNDAMSKFVAGLPPRYQSALPRVVAAFESVVQ